MRFLLLLLPILMFFSFREQNQSIEKIPYQQEEEYQTPFEAYPNPAKDVLDLRSSAFKDDKTRLFIFDVSGKLVFQQNSLHFNENETTTIDLSSLHSGVYFVQLSIKNYSATKKIVKI